MTEYYTNKSDFEKGDNLGLIEQVKPPMSTSTVGKQLALRLVLKIVSKQLGQMLRPRWVMSRFKLEKLLNTSRTVFRM